VAFTPDSDLQREVAGQPDDWAGVVARLPELEHALPAAGSRVAVIGCGTSFFMAQAYAARREVAGHGETDAFAASEHRLDRSYDAVLVITRSGTTTEVIDVLTSLRGRDLITTAIVATPGTPVTTLADRTILLPEVDEKSVVQTRFATSTLALLRASLGEDLSAAIADARAVLDEDEDSCLAGVVDAEQVTFVGRGWTIGLAAEAALKLRESAQFWTESYPAMEYRHGPVSIATAGRATWALGEVPPGLEAQVRGTGAHFESRAIDPLAELVRVHRLCLAKARQGDLDPDRPRHLTRSVILPARG
jgi:fructoselysine-6-P-deglycase FrlB-like protein